MEEVDPAVLVVDQSRTWCEYVANALEPAGYRVDWTVDTHTALERLEVGLHDLAIVDADLGTRRGADLIAALRRRHPSLRVVLTSGDATDADEDDAHLIGAFFVPKPFGRRALRTLVDACLAGAD